MKNMTKKMALLLAVALAASCLFAGLTMAQDAAAAEGESAGDSADMDLEAYFTELFASDGTESADGEEAESTGESAESTGENAEAAESAGEEGASEVTEADIMAFIMSALGMEEYADFDFEAFYADVQERVENGEELTIEEAFPEFYWEFYTAMFEGSEEEGYTIDMVVEGNSMIMYWIFLEELDEDAIAEVVSSVSESYESEETKASLKEAMESMSEAYNININDIEMGLVFVNGNDEVIYEMIYTYADLEDVEVPETTDEEGGSSDSSASEAAQEAEAAPEETEAE